MNSLQEIVSLGDRRQAAHLLVEYYLAYANHQEAIRHDWNYGAKWDFPTIRKLALSREGPIVARNVQTALGYSSIVDFEPDWRDHMTLLSVCWHALGTVGVPAQPMFERLADASASAGASRFRDFLARPEPERQLSRFGWEVVASDNGTEYRPAVSS